MIFLRRLRCARAAVRELEDRVPRAALPGHLQIWFEPFTELRAPKIFNLRTDPFERADVTSNTYWNWVLENVLSPSTATPWCSSFSIPSRNFRRVANRHPSPLPRRWRSSRSTPRRWADELGGRLGVLERRTHEIGNRRLRRPRVDAGERITLSPRSGSPSSTTTGHCGWRSPPTFNSTSWCVDWLSKPPPTRR